MRFILEQSHHEIYASAGGLAVVGPIINRYSGDSSIPVLYCMKYALLLNHGGTERLATMRQFIDYQRKPAKP